MSSQYGSYSNGFNINDNDDQFLNSQNRNRNNNSLNNLSGLDFLNTNSNSETNINYELATNDRNVKGVSLDDAFLVNNDINFDMSPSEIEKQFNLDMLNDVTSDSHVKQISNASGNLSTSVQYNNAYNELNRAISNVDINNTQYNDYYDNVQNTQYQTENSTSGKKTPVIQVDSIYNGKGGVDGNDNQSTTSYHSPAPVSISIKKNPSRNEAFSPESLGFSTNFATHQMSKSISNTLGRSYGDQLGSSLNNLVSPASPFDGLPDSSYGSYDDSFLRSPLNSPSFKSIGSPSSLAHLNPKSALSKESKLSRRRELHNAVERRRRDLIKEKIKELGSLIPPTMMYDSSKQKSAKDVKVNKNVILQKSIEYMMYLQEILDAQDRKITEMQEEIENLNLNDTGVQNRFEASVNNNTEFAISNTENSSTTNHNNDFANDSNSNSFLNMVNGSGSAANGNVNFDLAAFSENNIPKSDSKLKFMDFTNNRSEALDFSKLSDSGIKRFEETNNKSNDMLSFGFKTNMTNYNESNSTPNTFISPQDDFNNFLNEPSLKFESDADFLDQLLSKEPVGNSGYK